MNPIHLLAPDGRQTQHDPAQVAEMFRQGRLAPETLFWTEGMTDWQPIDQILPELPADAPAPERERPVYLRDPVALTGFLKRLLWIELAAMGVGLSFELAELGLARAAGGEATILAPFQLLLGFFMITLAILEGIVFLKWTYRANLNCRGFGARDMRFGPGWAIGCYFVPIANLFLPFQAMSEIWKASGGPVDWRAQPGSALVGWWWTATIVNGILAQIELRAAFGSMAADLREIAPVISVASSATNIALILLTLRLVTRILERQQRVVRGDPGSQFPG